ncbi:MAG TPA: DUF3025 domain-containing protein [Polyangiaceae bacterium]|nr:DUF3025 domain-containing protein [Polyangiaceae bacterium]
MRPLVAVRRATPFDGRFHERHVLFWPLAPAVRALGDPADFPPVEALDRVFGDGRTGDRGVRFVAASPRRRRGAPLDADALYDGRIALRGEIPTRSGCWHDLMNALVWGTFPRAKRALHARQHAAITARLPPGAVALLPRSPELDALALIDEGGVVVLADDADEARARLRVKTDGGGLRGLVGSGRARTLVFGHAIYESLALGVTPGVVAAVVLPDGHAEAHPVRAADEALARALVDRDRFVSPRELTRVDVRDVQPAAV